eukprot:2077345-Pyramimonas_sp.AAC.1
MCGIFGARSGGWRLRVQGLCRRAVMCCLLLDDIYYSCYYGILHAVYYTAFYSDIVGEKNIFEQQTFVGAVAAGCAYSERRFVDK